MEDPEDQGIGQEEEGKELQGEETIRRRESETTEYDYSTDDESLRMLMSETDQVTHPMTPQCHPHVQSAGCSGLGSRQSSSGSQANLGQPREEDNRAR